MKPLSFTAHDGTTAFVERDADTGFLMFFVKCLHDAVEDDECEVCDVILDVMMDGIEDIEARLMDRKEVPVS